MPGILAHGGTAGAAGEALFVLLPIAVFALLSRASNRRRAREEAQAAAAGESDTEVPAP